MYVCMYVCVCVCVCACVRASVRACVRLYMSGACLVWKLIHSKSYNIKSKYMSINDTRLLDTFLVNSGEILPELWPLMPLWASINLRSRCFINGISSSLDYINNDRPQVHWFGFIESGLKLIKLLVCSTELSMKFILLINVKIPTVLSRINTTSKSIKTRFRSVYEQLKVNTKFR